MRRIMKVGASVIVAGVAAMAVTALATGRFSWSAEPPGADGGEPRESGDSDAGRTPAAAQHSPGEESGPSAADDETETFPANYEECVAAGGEKDETNRHGVVECKARVKREAGESNPAFDQCKERGGQESVADSISSGATYYCSMRFTKRVKPARARLKDEEAQKLLSGLQSGSQMGTIHTITARAEKGDELGRKLRSALEDGDVRERRGAARLLVHYHRPSSLDFDSKTLDALQEALDDPDLRVRAHVADKLIDVQERHPDVLDISTEDLVVVASDLLEAEDEDLRREGVRAFRKLEPAGYADEMLEVARNDASENVRSRAWLAVGDLGTREHLDAMWDALQKPPRPDRGAVGYVLEKLGGADFPRIACRWMRPRHPDAMRDLVAGGVAKDGPFDNEYSVRDHRDTCGDLDIDLEPTPDDGD